MGLLQTVGFRAAGNVDKMVEIKTFRNWVVKYLQAYRLPDKYTV